jgi:hypothetical protein
MGCGCKEATKITPKIRQRRDICRNCQHATRTRRTEKRFVKVAGLTTRSVCEITNQNIAEMTADKTANCPLGSWKAEPLQAIQSRSSTAGDAHAGDTHTGSVCPYAVPNCCGKPAACPVLGQCNRDWRVSRDCPTRAAIENR